MKITKITHNTEQSHTWDIEVQETHQYSIKTNTTNIICHNSSVTQCSTNGTEPIRAFITEKIAKSGVEKVLVPNYPKYKKNYVIAWDMKSNLNSIKIAASMQKFIDMAMSFNTYLNYNHYPDGEIPISVVAQDIITAHKYGLRTMYYNNTPNDNEESSDSSNCTGGACSI